jgi:hypothetical protein
MEKWLVLVLQKWQEQDAMREDKRKALLRL